jgi:DDE family transposase
VGDKQNQPFQFSFNASLKVDFQGSQVTSDGGLILVRELDKRLGLEKLIEEHLNDSRQGLNEQFTLTDLLRQSGNSRLAGYEDLNDAERLVADPTFRLISSQRIWDRGAPRQEMRMPQTSNGSKSEIPDNNAWRQQRSLRIELIIRDGRRKSRISHARVFA